MNYLKHLHHTIKTSSPILYTIGWIHFIMGVGCIIGLLVDDRNLMGVNVWIKPLKFCISGGIYILTVGYLITLYPYSKRKKNIINNLTSWTLLPEILIIVTQAARGIQSHYNQSSLLDGILFGTMGILIAINVLIMILFIIDTARLKLKVPRPIQWALLMGWMVVLFGSWVGGQMISQMAHNVGMVDGGAGLPLVNWSTVAGDLRIAHFFGLHGIQIIPLFALGLYKNWKPSPKYLTIVVILFGLLYSGWIGYIFYQAKQGIPLLNI